MTSKEITITSKNQITIPSKIVRNLKLSKHRRLYIRQTDNKIILEPVPSLAQRLKPVWQQANKVKKPLTNEQLDESLRIIAAEKLDR